MSKVVRAGGIWALLTVSALSALSALCACSPAWAQTDARTAEQLLRSSGLWEQLSSVAKQVRAGIDDGASQSGSRLSAEESARLTRAVDAAYAAPRLRAAAARQVARDMQAAMVPAVVDWYDSATGVVITRLEEAAAADERSPDTVLQAGAARLAAMPETRRVLLQQIMAAARAAESAAQMAINTAVGVQQGLAAVQTDRAGPSAAELRAALDAQRPRLQAGFFSLMLAASALMHEPATEAQLAAYLGFLNSAAGRHFSAVVEGVLDTMFLDAATDLGRALPGTQANANT